MAQSKLYIEMSEPAMTMWFANKRHIDQEIPRSPRGAMWHLTYGGDTDDPGQLIECADGAVFVVEEVNGEW